MDSGRGSLSEKNLLELLMDWHKAGLSGLITLTRGQIQKAVLMSSGSILRAQSNVDSEKLGHVLVKRNLISPWDLEVALSQVQTNRRRLGQVLLGMSALKESVLNQTLVSQTRDIIFSMLDWQEGEYAERGDVDLSKEIQFEQLFTPEIILQGIRRIANPVLLLRQLGNLDAKMRLSPDYLERIRKVTLLTEEKSLLALLHKPSSLKELLTVSQLDKTLLPLGGRPAGYQRTATGGREHRDRASHAHVFWLHQAQLLRRQSRSARVAFHEESNAKQLGEMLVDSHVITEEQLKEALNSQSQVKGKKPLLGNVLVQKGFATKRCHHRMLERPAQHQEARRN